MEHFIVRYPGTVESPIARAHAAVPIWVGVAHFFDLFLLIYIIRSEEQILGDHPRRYWTQAQHARQGLVPRAQTDPAEPPWTIMSEIVDDCWDKVAVVDV